MSPSTRTAPIRPSLPALVWLAAAVWTGVLVAESLWWRDAAGAGTDSLLGCVALAVATGVLWRTRRTGALVLVTLGLCAGLAAGSLYWASWEADAAVLAAAHTTRWTGEVTSDPRVGRFGARSEVRLLGGRRVTVGWPSEEPTPVAGQTVEFFGEYRPPARDRWGRMAHQAGTLGTVSARLSHPRGAEKSLRGLVLGPRRRGLRALSAVPGAAGAVLDGVVLGERTRLSGTQAEADFKTTGLTHLVAVSGGHLVVVAVCLYWLLGRLRLPRRWIAGIVVTCLGLYVVASGVQPSAVRAWVMALIVVMIGMGDRRGDAVGALAATACLVVALNPPSAFDLGMRLSMVAVGGLVVFGRFAENWLTAGLSERAAPVVQPVALTLVAQAATLPLTVGTFGMLSLVAPLANVVASPLISVALAAGLAGIAVADVPLLGSVLGPCALTVARWSAGLCVRAAGWLAAWPAAAVPLGVNAAGVAVACLALAGLLWAWWPTPTRRASRAVWAVALAATIAVGVGPPHIGGPSMTLLDVGQGDAVLLRDGGRAALVDAGPGAGSLRDACARQGLRRLDAVILTHMHEDHIGGLRGLDSVVDVRAVYANASDARDSEPATPLRAGDSMRIGSMLLRVLWPPAAPTDPSANEASLVCVVECADTSVVLTGDAESDVLGQLISNGVIGDVDVLKLGHHGSADAVSPQTLAVLRPEFALISVGAGNRFGHPVPSTMTMLQDSGTRVLRTDVAGDITVRLGPNGYSISVQKRGTGATRCATLAVTRAGRSTQEHREYCRTRAQARLPHPQRAEAARRRGVDAPQEARWRGG